MPENKDVDEKLRESFKRVKDDIIELKISLNNEKDELNSIKTEMKEIKGLISEIKDNLLIFKKSSIGNDGVINNHQQSSTIINNHQQPTISLQAKKSFADLKQTLTFAFKSLTDREFSVFLALVELENALPEVTYTELADRLKISEPTVRNVVNRLISKNLPLEKVRFFNKKVSLSLSKDFKKSDLLAELISLRQNPHSQTTLFNTF